MGQGKDWYTMWCKDCGKYTTHICEKQYGNFYCVKCGSRLGDRAPVIQRHKEFFEPEGRVKRRVKSPIIIVKK